MSLERSTMNNGNVNAAERRKDRWMDNVVMNGVITAGGQLSLR